MLVVIIFFLLDWLIGLNEIDESFSDAAIFVNLFISSGNNLISFISTYVLLISICVISFIRHGVQYYYVF